MQFDKKIVFKVCVLVPYICIFRKMSTLYYDSSVFFVNKIFWVVLSRTMLENGNNIVM